jgi:hypothetical protein
MNGHEALRQWYRLADQLIAASSHAELAEAARILALNCAHYANRYGELPIEEHMDFLNAAELSDEQAGLIAAGMKSPAPVWAGKPITAEVQTYLGFDNSSSARRSRGP